jgi:hypothetical protein
MGIAREICTFETMLIIYCRGHHSEPLCERCGELLTELKQVLTKCPFGDRKPLCSKCSEDCISKEGRKRIAAVMRYSGSRMLCRHPALTFLHVLDSMKAEPEL